MHSRFVKSAKVLNVKISVHPRPVDWLRQEAALCHWFVGFGRYLPSYPPILSARLIACQHPSGSPGGCGGSGSPGSSGGGALASK